MSGKGRIILLVAGAFAVALVVRVSFALSARYVNDSADYLSAAYNMAQGRGFVSDVKWHFFTDRPARHWALGERQPAYPALLAVALKLRATDAAAQAATAIVGAATVAAIVWVTAVLYGLMAAMAAVVMSLAATVLLVSGTSLEPVGLHGLVLLLLAASVVGALRDERWAPVTGLLIALLALNRGEGLATGLGALLYLAAARRWRVATVALVAAVMGMLPYWVINAKTNASPFYSEYADHLRVKVFAEGMWYGYGKSFASVGEFLRGNWPFALRRWVRNCLVYSLSLLRLSWVGLGLGALGLALLVRRQAPPYWTVFVALGAFHCAAVATMWSTTSGRPEPHHLAPPLAVLAMPLAAWGLSELFSGQKKWVPVAAAVIGLAYLPADLACYSAGSSVVSTVAACRVAGKAVEGELGPEDVVASCRPWHAWLALRRPVVMLPRELTRERKLEFLRRYRVRAIVDWVSNAQDWTSLPEVEKVFEDPATGAVALRVKSWLSRAPTGEKGKTNGLSPAAPGPRGLTQ